MDHAVAVAQQLSSTQRQQPRITRARASEKNSSGKFWHRGQRLVGHGQTTGGNPRWPRMRSPYGCYGCHAHPSPPNQARRYLGSPSCTRQENAVTIHDLGVRRALIQRRAFRAAFVGVDQPQGRSNKAIGLSLGISEDGAKAHVKQIFLKLRVADCAEAVAEALRRGILSLNR